MNRADAKPGARCQRACRHRGDPRVPTQPPDRQPERRQTEPCRDMVLPEDRNRDPAGERADP